MSIPISKSLSQKIKALSFFNALLVVILHASTGNSPQSSESVALLIEKLISIGLCRFGVPYFFMVSVFFLPPNMTIKFRIPSF